MVKNILIMLKNLPSKRAIQKTAEATGDLIGSKIADRIASISKKPSNNNDDDDDDDDDEELTTHKKIYISIRKTANC